MSNVVNLSGEEIMVPGESSEELVKTIEKLLERAKSGDLHGIHAVMVHSDQCVSSVSTLKPTYRAIGALVTMVSDLAKEM